MNIAIRSYDLDKYNVNILFELENAIFSMNLGISELRLLKEICETSLTVLRSERKMVRQLIKKIERQYC